MEQCRDDAGVTALSFPLINIDRDTGENQGTSMYAIRCFKNHDWLRYHGKVHEQLADLSGKGRHSPCYVKDVIIYHTGYSSSLLRQKIERNLELLNQKTGQGSPEPLDYFYLAECHYGLGQYAEAAGYARKAAEAGVEPVGQEDRPYSILVQSLIVQKCPGQEILAVLETASAKYPESSKFPLLWGLYSWTREDYGDAEEHFLLGLELYHEEESENPVKAGQSARFVPQALFYLGETARWKRQGEAALEYLAESLRLQNRNAKALQSLCLLLGNVEAEDVIALLDELYDKHRDGEFLARVLTGTKLKKAGLYYEKCSGKKLFCDYERQLFDGDIPGAAEKLTDSLRNHLDLGSWQQVFHAPEGRREIWPFLPAAYHRAAAGGPSGDEERRIRQKWKELGASFEKKEP